MLNLPMKTSAPYDKRSIGTINELKHSSAWNSDSLCTMNRCTTDFSCRTSANIQTGHASHEQQTSNAQTGHASYGQKTSNAQTGHASHGQQNSNAQTGHASYGQQNSNAQTGHASYGQQNSNAQTGHASYGQQNSNAQTGHASYGQQNSNAQTGHASYGQQNSNVQTGHASYGQQNSNVQTGHASYGQQTSNVRTGQQQVITPAYSSHTQQQIVTPAHTSRGPAQKTLPKLLHPIQKGQKIILNSRQTLTSLRVNMGWNVKNPACDIDVSAFLLNASGKVISDEWFVFYGQTTSPDRSTVFTTSAGEDRQSISIDFRKLHPDIKKIVFVLTIHEALQKRLNFSMIQDAYIRILDGNEELVSFRLYDYYANVISMLIGEIYLHNGSWKFHGIGNGYAKDLAGLCKIYGVEVQN